MRKIFLAIVFAVSLVSLRAQDVIAVTNNTTSSFYTSLDSAVFYAQNGDYVYLPGGSFTVNNIQINKNLNIVGAGFNTDSTLATGPTMIIGNIVLVSGADGGSLQGLYVTGNVTMGTNSVNQTVNNFSISRSSIQMLSLSYNGSGISSSVNLFFKECVIRGSLYGGYTHNVVFSKCIFQGDFDFFSGQVQVNNCLFLKNACCGHTIASCSGVNFSNNIIREQSYVMDGTPGNTYQNNLFCNGSPIAGGNVAVNNIYGVHPDSIFVNGSFPAYNIAGNYQLRPSCAGNNAGTDGTDIGIYGTAEPFKAGSVPVNPHIRFKTIPSVTDGQGNLNVNIRVGAQQQ